MINDKNTPGSTTQKCQAKNHIDNAWNEINQRRLRNTDDHCGASTALTDLEVKSNQITPHTVSTSSRLPFSALPVSCRWRGMINPGRNGHETVPVCYELE
eukprot:643364-Hanusia_phi.AAC.5